MSLVDELLSSVSFDEGWRLIERFSVLVRESGSLDERAAAHFISTRLKTMGVPQEVHEAEVFISVPRSASVEVGRATLAGKPPSFSASTGEQGLAAEPVHVPADRDRGGSDLFKGVVEGDIPDVRGRIVVTEGYPMPVSVARFEAAGAAGQVYINPGSRVHWGICTPIWGAPTEDQMRHKPATPIIAINRIDGDALLGRMAKGADRITLCTELDEKWISCPLPVARIDGGDEDFVLVHGHYDSWDIGIGDNAVGNATLLELARIFHEHREGLARSVRIAWWPAHSTGRYGGSTWYADNFGVDLYNHCVAAVNIDSPGCRGATAYDEVPWMVEAEDVCRSSIHAVAGIDPGRQRPLRAGDYSFNQLGVSSFFMLLSNIPDEERQRLGFYPVGGCGGNIAWHTEADRLGVADRDNLERDLRVYLAAIGQFVEDEVIPLDYRKTVIELDGQLREYEPKAHKRFDITAIRRGLGSASEAAGQGLPRDRKGESASEDRKRPAPAPGEAPRAARLLRIASLRARSRHPPRADPGSGPDPRVRASGRARAPPAARRQGGAAAQRQRDRAAAAGGGVAPGRDGRHPQEGARQEGQGQKGQDQEDGGDKDQGGEGEREEALRERPGL